MVTKMNPVGYKCPEVIVWAQETQKTIGWGGTKNLPSQQSNKEAFCYDDHQQVSKRNQNRLHVAAQTLHENPDLQSWGLQGARQRNYGAGQQGVRRLTGTDATPFTR